MVCSTAGEARWKKGTITAFGREHFAFLSICGFMGGIAAGAKAGAFSPAIPCLPTLLVFNSGLVMALPRDRWRIIHGNYWAL